MKLASETLLLGAVYLVAGVMSTDSSGTDHKVSVGKNGPSFDPPHVSAKKGDTITFTFYQDHHTLTQTHFANPCAGTNPPSDSFCTVTSASSNTNSTGEAGYPAEGLQPPSSSSPLDSGSGYPTSGQTPTDTTTTSPPSAPSPQPSPSTKPSDSSPSPVKDPSQALASPAPSPAACLCPAPITSSSGYPTGPEPSAPKEKTCDSKCIEVAGQCQTSTDCDAQSKSPSDTKCKIEDGQCKRCGQSSLVKKKRSLNNHGSFPYFGRLLRRRDTPIDDTVEKVNVTDAPVDSNTQLDTAPTSQQPSLLSQDNTSSTDKDSSPLSGAGGVSTTAVAPGAGADSTPTLAQDPSGGSSSKPDGSAAAKSNGLDSGFVKVSEEQKSTGKSWKITITDDSKPLWFMCATINHCTNGMVFAVNVPDFGDKTFDKFVQAAKGSTCPTQYPTQPNLQGDGCTAAAPPCNGDKKETPQPSDGGKKDNPAPDGGKKDSPPSDNGLPPVSSGGNAESPAKTPTPTQPIQSTPAVTSAQGNNPPASSPSPDAPQPTSSDGKTSSGQGRRFDARFLSFSFYVVIIFASFLLSAPPL